MEDFLPAVDYILQVVSGGQFTAEDTNLSVFTITASGLT